MDSQAMLFYGLLITICAFESSHQHVHQQYDPSYSQSHNYDYGYHDLTSFKCYQCSYSKQNDLGDANCDKVLIPQGIPTPQCKTNCYMSLTTMNHTDYIVGRGCTDHCQESSNENFIHKCCHTNLCNHFNPPGSHSSNHPPCFLTILFTALLLFHKCTL